MAGNVILLKHSGRWTEENTYDYYTVDIVDANLYATYIELYDLLVTHLCVDVRCKNIIIKYKIEGEIHHVQIHIDMG